MPEGFPRQEIKLSDNRDFPQNDYELDPQALYDAAAYFYFTPDITRLFREHLRISPITEEMMEDLEAYKPPLEPLVGMTVEEFRDLRQMRDQQRQNSAQGLVNFINHPWDLPTFLSLLNSNRGTQNTSSWLFYGNSEMIVLCPSS